MSGARKSTPAIEVSFVVPARDEGPAIVAMIEEIHRLFDGKEEFEIVYVDDGSGDDTPRILERERRGDPRLRHIRHKESCGKSAAIWTGVTLALGGFVVTLDGDMQNDPAYVSGMLALLRDGGDTVGLVAGQRTKRGDGWIRLVASRIANGVRGRLLGDNTRDTACGLKVFRRDAFLMLPYFDNMHRFLPALMTRAGFAVRHADVIDRPRQQGESKYGIIDRLLAGIVDLLGVMWLRRRRRRTPDIREL